MKGAKGRPTYAIFVVKLSKAYLHGVKAVLMEAIQSVFEHGMLEILVNYNSLYHMFEISCIGICNIQA